MAAVVTFVDLAGSERAADMGEQQHEKLRQKEVRGTGVEANMLCCVWLERAHKSCVHQATMLPQPLTQLCACILLLPQAANLHKSLQTLNTIVRGLADNQVSAAAVAPAAKHKGGNGRGD